MSKTDLISIEKIENARLLKRFLAADERGCTRISVFCVHPRPKKILCHHSRPRGVNLSNHFIW
jgi:hypothetical protein